MNRHVVRLTSGNGKGAEAPAWEKKLEEEGFVLLQATSPRQAAAYARGYPLVGVLADADDPELDVRDLAPRLRECWAADPSAPPLIGVLAREVGGAELEALAGAGFDGFFMRDAPAAFLLHWLRSRQMLQELQVLEATGVDVRSLAKATREMIHTLSQPLAVLQGRLQLLASKAPEDDPRRELFKTLVALIEEATRHLRELQELHRKFS